MELETKIYIDQLAEAMIKEYDLKRPFTNIQEKIEEMGGTIIMQAGLDTLLDPIIRKIDSTHFELLIPEGMSKEKKIDQMLLELGHLFLHMGYRTCQDCWSRQPLIHRRFCSMDQQDQAHALQLAIKMPEHEFRSVLIGSTINRTVNTHKIAEYFGVTETMVVQRGRFLDLLY